MNDKVFFNAAMRWTGKYQGSDLYRGKPATESWHWPEWLLHAAGRHPAAKIGNRTGETEVR